MPDDANHEEIPKGDCPHLTLAVEEMEADAAACAVCGTSDHLRICLTCGAVHCCESLGAHDRDHFEAAGHPLIRPHRTDYDFLWCYECEAYLT